jgi:hypothetical protein
LGRCRSLEPRPFRVWPFAKSFVLKQRQKTNASNGVGSNDEGGPRTAIGPGRIWQPPDFTASGRSACWPDYNATVTALISIVALPTQTQSDTSSK